MNPSKLHPAVGGAGAKSGVADAKTDESNLAKSGHITEDKN